jgi:hypothetical protein
MQSRNETKDCFKKSFVARSIWLGVTSVLPGFFGVASRKPKRDGGGLVRELRVTRDIEYEMADELAKLYTEMDRSSPVGQMSMLSRNR